MNKPWQDKAKGMQIGATRRIVCPYCNKDKSMVLNRVNTGVTAFCFRCMEHLEYMPVEVAIKDLKDMQDVQEYKKLTVACVLEECIPLEELHDNHPAREWLLKAGIDPVHAPCVYHPQTNRAAWILPDAVLLRRVYDVPNSPKYILVSEVDKVPPVVYSKGCVSTVVICEDVLSAYRIAEVEGVAGVSILGTNPTALQGHSMVMQFPNARYIIWTDNDEGGDKGAHKLSVMLRKFGKSFIRIRTEKDPKMYQKEVIESIIRGGN